MTGRDKTIGRCYRRPHAEGANMKTTKRAKRVVGAAGLEPATPGFGGRDQGQMMDTSRALVSLGHDAKAVRAALKSIGTLAVDLASEAVTAAGARRALRAITADLRASRAA